MIKNKHKHQHTNHNSDKWLNEMTKTDKNIDTLLDTFIDIAADVIDELNNKNKDALNDGRKLLIDSPIKVECNCGDNCQCGENCTCKDDSLSTKLDVKNAVNASDLKIKSSVSNEKRAELLLENIFSLIVDVNDEGENSVTIDLIDEWNEQFPNDNLSELELENIIDILYSYLTSKGFEVEADLTTVNEESEEYMTSVMEINW